MALEREVQMNGWCFRQDLDERSMRSAELSASTLPLHPQRC